MGKVVDEREGGKLAKDVKEDGHHVRKERQEGRNGRAATEEKKREERCELKLERLEGHLGRGRREMFERERGG